MAASGEDSALFAPGPSNWRDTGVIIGIAGKMQISGYLPYRATLDNDTG